MLTTTLALAAVVWVLLDEPDAVGAAESRSAQAVAVVDGIVLTEDEILHHARHELEELEARRTEILERAVDTGVCDLLIEAEAKRRGIDRLALLALEVDAKLDTVSGDDLDDEARYQLRWQAFVDELHQLHDVEILATPGD